MERHRILIIDDDAMFRQSLSALLVKHFSVDEVGSAKEAFNKLAKNQYNCILLDYKLPDTDGLRIFCDIQRRYATPVIIVTGSGDESLAVEFLQHGAKNYIPKNKLNKSILQKIEEAIRSDLEESNVLEQIKSKTQSLMLHYAIKA